MRVLVFIVVAIVLSIIGYIAKRIAKGRMMDSLGREVGDHELTSLNSWMEVHENEGDRNAQNNRPS